MTRQALVTAEGLLRALECISSKTTSGLFLLHDFALRKYNNIQLFTQCVLLYIIIKAALTHTYYLSNVKIYMFF